MTLMEHGFEVAVLHNRGVSNTEYTSPEFADLSRNEEFDKNLELVRKLAPDAELVGVGLSMGANVMMRLAGVHGKDFPLKAMVAINNPFDIWLTINLMRGKIYEKHLAQELKRSLVIRDGTVKRDSMAPPPSG